MVALEMTSATEDKLLGYCIMGRVTVEQIFAMALLCSQGGKNKQVLGMNFRHSVFLFLSLFLSAFFFLSTVTAQTDPLLSLLYAHVTALLVKMAII